MLRWIDKKCLIGAVYFFPKRPWELTAQGIFLLKTLCFSRLALIN